MTHHSRQIPPTLQFATLALLTGLLASTVHYYLWQTHHLLTGILLWLTITTAHLWLYQRLKPKPASPSTTSHWATFLLFPFLIRLALLTLALVFAKTLTTSTIHPPTWLMLWGALPILIFFIAERKTITTTTKPEQNDL